MIDSPTKAVEASPQGQVIFFAGPRHILHVKPAPPSTTPTPSATLPISNQQDTRPDATRADYSSFLTCKWQLQNSRDIKISQFVTPAACPSPTATPETPRVTRAHAHSQDDTAPTTRAQVTTILTRDSDLSVILVVKWRTLLPQSPPRRRRKLEKCAKLCLDGEVAELQPPARTNKEAQCTSMSRRRTVFHLSQVAEKYIFVCVASLFLSSQEVSRHLVWHTRHINL